MTKRAKFVIGTDFSTIYVSLLLPFLLKKITARLYINT